ncbi:DUF3951 domain-containing protein [Virgibacillus ihumii]|uniref:DUF3951 domain-containing protein n=1 Tax=Virgibacillus ihumii TaxID=2686091 RepID=UPI00157DD3A8|nr:DUF3951 domain-containing protein [Virgibacillus ihumii]
MNIIPVLLFIAVSFILILMIFIACKIIITGKTPRSYYTPLEAIYGQGKEFQEEVQQEEQEDEDEKGDDKNKNNKYPQ